jgi:outer membrane lipoprotein-sorting protein
MKTNRFIVIAMMAFTIMLFACNSKTPKQTAPAAENQTEAAKETTKGKYAIKSGIVEYKTQMMGMDIKQVLTFDDYGKKEVTEMLMEMMGTKMHTVTLTKDGFQYSYDLEKKTGTKSPYYGGGTTSIDFENLSEAMSKDMNLKKLGNEQFLGKTCEKMTIDYEKMKMKGSFLVYKGLALKMEADVGTMKMNLIGEKFAENPEIPASKFEIPADVTITEN